jgi:hypothetical protein
MKTVLAPGAPWPDYTPKPVKAKQPKPEKPPISATSKIKRTNDNFEKWRIKNAAVDLSAALSRK